LNTWANSVLGLSGNSRDKAFLVNEVGEPNWSILQFNLSANSWQNKGKDFTESMDAITDSENRTHYADFNTITALEQLRFVVQSVMNFMRLPIGLQQVLMPEMQFFGLPSDADRINKSDVATTTYLKAEDAEGNLYDILGRHQQLSSRSYYSYTSFRFYVGAVANVKTDAKNLYLDVYNTNGNKATGSAGLEGYSTPYREISVYGDHRTLSYYEVFVYSANNERIILSSGYTGGLP